MSGSAAPEALVRFENVSFGYSAAAVPVIANASFEIRRGEILTLLGHSGCGKSTLLKMVAGLIRPRSGRCEFQGEEIQDINTRIGYMTQGDTLLPWRTVEANVALPLRLKKVSGDVVAQKVQAYLKMLRLDRAASQFPAQLSGGMKRRALLARSVIADPIMVLMDEPFAAIDADLREDLHDSLRRTVEELQQTVLFVTHDIGEAALLSDRVLVIGGSPSASVVDTIEVPFGSRRNLAELRTMDAYFDMQKRLRRALSQGKTLVH